MSILDVIILSIIEGITEFLPISSTGHLILASKFLFIPTTEFVKTFEIVIQLGAILAVVVLYFRRVMSNLTLIPKILTAFVPTAIVGFALYDFIKQYLFETPEIVMASLFLGGVALIGLELYFKGSDAPSPQPSPKGRGSNDTTQESNHKSSIVKHKSKTTIDILTYKKAFFIGVFQSISVVPGMSRAAATIFGGLFMGMDRKSAVEFSFLLAIPTMAAASGFDLLQTGASFTNQEWIELVIGFVIAFLVAFVVIKWLLKFIQTHTFIPFGIYRIILAIIMFGLFMLHF